MPLTIIAANSGVGGPGIITQLVQVGEAVGHIQPLRLSSTGPTSGKHMKADATSAINADVKGISITSAPADGWVVMVTQGPILVGAALTDTAAYALSATPGGIDPFASLVAGNFVTYLGMAVGTQILDVKIQATGRAKP